MLNAFGKTCPTRCQVFFANDSQIQDHFGVRVYPTTLIIKDGTNVIYQGDIEGVEKVLENELDL